MEIELWSVTVNSKHEQYLDEPLGQCLFQNSSRMAVFLKHHSQKVLLPPGKKILSYKAILQNNSNTRKTNTCLLINSKHFH